MKPGSDDPARGAQAFLEWARGAAVPISIPRHDADYDDLSFIGDVIGNARVVAFGENAHYLHEWNRFRARLFKYLVRDHGFSVFILESGLVEGRHIHDYVDGKDVPWERVVGSVTNGWGVWAELQELIVWMREYNADPANRRRLRFYCTDGSGKLGPRSDRLRCGAGVPCSGRRQDGGAHREGIRRRDAPRQVRRPGPPG